MNEFGKYRLFRKYVSLDGVNYTPLDEYQALLVENNTCQCGYRELEYRFDGEYKEDAFYKYEIWNEYSFCPTDSSYDELTGNVDYRNPITAEGVMLATYLGNGSISVELCYNSSFYERIAINNTELGKKYTSYTFNNYDINEVKFSNVTNIRNYSLYGCELLKSVTIPSTVTSIGSNAFEYCEGLTSVTIPNSVTSIGNNSFRYCNSLSSVDIGSGVTSIGDYAFESCGVLTSVEIGNGVKSIGYASFQNCTSLTSIVIPDSVEIIGGYAFSGCTNLTYAEIGESVTSIGNWAFRNCTSLTSIVITDSVESIGTYAFRDCKSLTSVEIGSGVTSIGDNAFQYCKSLKSITCYATTAPSLGSSTFSGLPTNGTLHVPSGSDYSSWLSRLPSGWTIEYI